MSLYQALLFEIFQRKIDQMLNKICLNLSIELIRKILLKYQYEENYYESNIFKVLFYIEMHQIMNRSLNCLLKLINGKLIHLCLSDCGR
jgi:hypothetical protein